MINIFVIRGKIMIGRTLGKMEGRKSGKLDNMEAESNTRQTIKQNRRSNTTTREDNLNQTQ